MTTARLGIIGCGNISRRYATGMARFRELQIVGCADLVQELADRLARDACIRAYSSIEELLADPSIDIVVNITPPGAHLEVTLAALGAGKHVYVEKPIALDLASAQQMRAAAAEAGRRIGSAPDTFLGSAGQTARAAIDAGLIGKPLGASASIAHSKAEAWHPNPTFLFKPGGGPLLDLGPYYITGLVNLLGPVVEISGFTRIGAPERIVTAPNRGVDRIGVEVPTHAVAVGRFASGALLSLQASFDVWDTEHPPIEVYGTRGMLSVPDPNTFDGDVRIRLHGNDWRVLDPVIPPTGPMEESVQLLRGLGVADLAAAVAGLPHRASAELAEHVLEVLEAIQLSSDSGTTVRLATTVERPAPAPPPPEVCSVRKASS